MELKNYPKDLEEYEQDAQPDVQPDEQTLQVHPVISLWFYLRRLSCS